MTDLDVMRRDVLDAVDSVVAAGMSPPGEVLLSRDDADLLLGCDCSTVPGVRLAFGVASGPGVHVEHCLRVGRAYVPLDLLREPVSAGNSQVAKDSPVCFVTDEDSGT